MICTPLHRNTYYPYNNHRMVQVHPYHVQSTNVITLKNSINVYVNEFTINRILETVWVKWYTETPEVVAEEYIIY